MEFREFNSGDKERLLELSRLFETSPFGFDPKYRALAKRFEPVFASDMIQAPSTLTIVALEKSRIVGFVTAGMNSVISGPARRKIGSILLLAVDRANRGAGIGKSLVGRALSWLASNGIETVTVGTDLTNIPAVNVYESFGFRLRASWNIFRCYDPSSGISSELSPFVDTAKPSTFDPFMLRFDRPVSLLREPKVDRDSVKAFLEDGFRRQVAKEESVNLQYFEAGKPMALVSASRDQLGMKTLGIDRNIYRISDLIVLPEREESSIGVELLTDLKRRLYQTALLEMWVPGEREDLVHLLSLSGFVLSYTGLSFHLHLS